MPVDLCMITHCWATDISFSVLSRLFWMLMEMPEVYTELLVSGENFLIYSNGIMNVCVIVICQCKMIGTCTCLFFYGFKARCKLMWYSYADHQFVLLHFSTVRAVLSGFWSHEKQYVLQVVSWKYLSIRFTKMSPVFCLPMCDKIILVCKILQHLNL